MGLFLKKKSRTPLFDLLLSISSSIRKNELKSHFSGMGNHEILAIFQCPHYKSAIDKINQHLKSKPEQIRAAGQVDNSGGIVYYIRGTFTKEDAHFFLHELQRCMKKGDDVRVTVPE
ncbi:hypothetical protein J7K93_02155 [bacterium]|nr:hypothetical protein [bacterium]